MPALQWPRRVAIAWGTGLVSDGEPVIALGDVPCVHDSAVT